MHSRSKKVKNPIEAEKRKRRRKQNRISQAKSRQTKKEAQEQLAAKQAMIEQQANEIDMLKRMLKQKNVESTESLSNDLLEINDPFELLESFEPVRYSTITDTKEPEPEPDTAQQSCDIRMIDSWDMQSSELILDLRENDIAFLHETIDTLRLRINALEAENAELKKKQIPETIYINSDTLVSLQGATITIPSSFWKSKPAQQRETTDHAAKEFAGDISRSSPPH